MSIVSTVTGFFTGKVRLIVEYVLIAVIIAVAATAFTLWLQAKELNVKNDELNSRVATIEGVNAVQDATINTLQDLRQKDAEAMSGLIADMKTLSKNDGMARKKLTELEKSNATVRSYLDEPLPTELACMLNPPCPKTSGQGGASKAGGSAGGVVRATPAPVHQEKP